MQYYSDLLAVLNEFAFFRITLGILLTFNTLELPILVRSRIGICHYRNIKFVV